MHEIGKQELAKITADDWQSAIRLATKQEKLYAQIDQLDTQTEPNVQDEPVQDDPIVQDEIVQNVLVVTPGTAHKCTNCNFETVQKRCMENHMNSFIQCSLCTETFCGRYAKRQHKSHQRQHDFKPKNAHICHICSKCYQYAYLLQKHLKWSACGRQ